MMGNVASKRRRILSGGLVGASALVVLVVLGSRAYRDWSDRAALSRAVADIERGALAEARHVLERLARSRPGDPEVAHRLGVCAYGLGDVEAAAEGFRAVPPDSPFGPEAATALAEIALNGGTYAEAERALLAALDAPATGPEAASRLRVSLALVLQRQLRLEEVRPMLRAAWPHAADPLRIVQLHATGDDAFDTAEVREALKEAHRRCPDDDRVWLGLAYLALRSGDAEGAGRWLDRCEAARPDDPAVLLARLRAARIVEDLRGARDALERMPAAALSTVERLRLRSWFAARLGDDRAEREALQRLLELRPADAPALERLADLSLRAGDRDRAAGLRERKARLDDLRNRYLNLVRREDPDADAPELARLAGRLGRPFEARAWGRLARGTGPGGPPVDLPDLRAQADVPDPESAKADLLAWLSGRPLSGRLAGDPGPPPAFEDAAGASGLRFAFDNGRTPLRQLPETMGGGVAILDFDDDGWLDVYCVQGGPLGPSGSAPDAPGDRLFRNLGGGTFEDVTESAGLPAKVRGYGQGVTVGDVDDDGFPDIFVTRLDSYALYRNLGDGTFEDATGPWGLAGPRDWPTSAAFADIDDDGDLDLYVCHYLEWDLAAPRTCRDPDTGEYTYCDVQRCPATHDRLFRNDGGRFVDVTGEAGIVDPDGRGLGVLAADLDADGHVDFYVANDTTANFLFRNRGDGTFEEVGHAAGVAAGADGGYQAGMGIAGGDFNRDGRIDLAVTNFFRESTTLYENLGDALFVDRTRETGLRAASRALLGFGVASLDFNNDTHLDLITANGHVQEIRGDFPRAMPAQLLAGDGRGRLVDVTGLAGPPLSTPRVARGLAVGDLDRDGRPDVLVHAHDAPLADLRNRTEAGRWVALRLVGTASNRDAVGAAATVSAGGVRQTAWRSGGGSYQSAGSPELHFGLGDAEAADSVEVRWPSGRVDRFEDLAADALYEVVEGGPSPRRLGP